MQQALGQFVFDEGNHLAVVVAIADVEQHEAVQCIAVPRRVDLGIDDAVAGAPEKPTTRANRSRWSRR